MEISGKRLFVTILIATALAVAATETVYQEAFAADGNQSDNDIAISLARQARMTGAAPNGCPEGFRALTIENDCAQTVYVGEDPDNGPGPTTCMSTATGQCGPNQFCSIPAACTSNASCGSGQTCDLISGQCMCNSGSTCANNQTCNDEYQLSQKECVGYDAANNCVTNSMQCTDCDTKTGNCICSGGQTCPSGTTCTDLQPECQGGICDYSKIEPGEKTGCSTSGDCPKNQFCNTALGPTGLCQFTTTTAANFKVDKLGSRNNQKVICVPGVVPNSFTSALPGGTACTTNSQCQSFWCNGGYCANPITWGGDIWPRTGCKMVNGNLVCETGDCGGADCNYHSGTPPFVLAEITATQPPGQDFYDVSQVNGENIGVSMAPTFGTFQSQPAALECVPDTTCGTGTCTVNGACPCSTSTDCPYLTQTCPTSGPSAGFCTASNQCGLCTMDTNCTDFSSTGGQGYCSCSAESPCPSPYTCVNGLCSGTTYECGTPGAATNINYNPILLWPDIATEPCLWNAKQDCPTELQDVVPVTPAKGCQNCDGKLQTCVNNACQNIVGCYSPGKACAASPAPPGLSNFNCSGNVPLLCAQASDCPFGTGGSQTMTCSTNGQCICTVNSDCPANFQCTQSGGVSTCTPVASAPGWDTWVSLYGCAGGTFYDHSGYGSGSAFTGQVCGCPPWSDPNPIGAAYCGISGSNPASPAHNYNWEVAPAGNTGPGTSSLLSTQGYAALFKSACPTAYSYAFDDKTSTYNCVGKTPGPSYIITFCPKPLKMKKVSSKGARKVPAKSNGDFDMVGYSIFKSWGSR